MARKTKKKEVTASLTFSWDKNKPIPTVDVNNVTRGCINDVFALSVENLLASNPEYYPILMAQMKTIYDFMYSSKTPIN